MPGHPPQQAGAQTQIQIVELMRRDSLDITTHDRDEVRRQVLAAPQSRILITHGTDRMVKTATELRDLCPEKTIVLTGAAQPYSMRRSDAAFNVGFALAALSLLPPGVYVAMNGQTFAAHDVLKQKSSGRFTALDQIFPQQQTDRAGWEPRTGRTD